MNIFQRLGLVLPAAILIGISFGWLVWSDIKCDGVLVVKAWPPGTACVAEHKEAPDDSA